MSTVHFRASWRATRELDGFSDGGDSNVALGSTLMLKFRLLRPMNGQWLRFSTVSVG
jgi:hypothetical protein